MWVHGRLQKRTIHNLCYTTESVTIPTLASSSTLFPNPTHDAITIKSDAGVYSSYTVTDAIGTTVMQGTITGAQTQVDMKELADGVYILSLSPALSKGEGTRVVRQVVKY